MKKIVGILAAAAIAASVFAADVSAKVKLTGSLFDYKKDSISAFTLNNHQSHNWEPDMSLSISGDQAGAKIDFKTLNEWGSGEGETSTNWNIWFKPVDILKFNIGSVDVALNKETIDYSTITSVASNGGYGLELDTNGIFFGVYMDQGFGKAWFTEAKKIAKTAAKVAYSADFGTISGMFIYDGVTDSVNTIEAGLGYANSSLVDGLSFFVDGKFVSKDSANSVVADLFVNFASGAFGIKAYVAPTINLQGDAFAGLNFKVRVDYKIDNIGIYLVGKCDNIAPAGANVADNGWAKNPVVIKPGVTGSVGAMSWELAVEAKIATGSAWTNDSFHIGVPVSFTVNF